MRVFALVSLMLLPAAALAACGSSNAADLFGGGGNGATVVDAAAEATSNGNPETPGSDGGSTPGDAGKKKDAGGGPNNDAGSPNDAGDTPETSTSNDPGIFCGEADGSRSYCNVSSEYCCIRDVGGLTFDCNAKGAQCIGGLTVPCTDQVDCNGKICCATYSTVGSGGYQKVECKSTCGANTATTTEYRLCDPNAAVDECQAVGATCQESTAIPGWFLCKN